MEPSGDDVIGVTPQMQCDSPSGSHSTSAAVTNGFPWCNDTSSISGALMSRGGDGGSEGEGQRGQKENLRSEELKTTGRERVKNSPTGT